MQNDSRQAQVTVKSDLFKKDACPGGDHLPWPPFSYVASENGVFPWSPKKSTSGDPRMGGWGVGVRFLEAGASTRVPGVWVPSTARWFSSSCCGRTPALSSASPEGPGPELLCHRFSPRQSWVRFSLGSHRASLPVPPDSCLGPALGPVLLLGPPGCYGERTSEKKKQANEHIYQDRGLC